MFSNAKRGERFAPPVRHIIRLPTRGFLLEELDFAELEAGAVCHLDELEAIEAEASRALRLEAILLLVLVTKGTVVRLFVQNSP